MALTNLAGVMEYPSFPTGLRDVNTTPNSITVNSATDLVAVIVRMGEAGTIDKVHFLTRTSLQNHTVRVSFQNLTAAGEPDGTDTHYRDYSILATDDDVWLSTGLITADGTDVGAKKTVSAGDEFAIVFANSGYTSGDQFQLAVLTPASDAYRLSQPYFSSNTGSTWSINESDPCIAIELNDASFPFLQDAVPAETFTAPTVSNASSPDEYAMKIQVPVPMRAVGIFVKGSSASNVQYNLLSAADAVLAGPLTSTIQETTQVRVRHIYFSSAVNIDKDTVYRISWKPTDATSRIFWHFGFNSAAHRKVLMNGLNMQLSTRTDAGSWTDDPTEMPLMGFLIDQLGNDAGGGGSCNFGALTNGTRVVPVAG